MYRMYSFAVKPVGHLSLWLLAVVIFLLVVGCGAFAGLNIAKRQFEAQAQNIAAVLRGGIGVADGVVTSLDAADHSPVDHELLQSHFADVLGTYEYISGLGRFEELNSDQLPALARRFVDQDAGVKQAWYFDEKGSSLATDTNPSLETHLPLTVFKSRFVSKQKAHLDLTGLDLLASGNKEAAHLLANNSPQTRLTSVPALWKRPGELMLLRSDLNDDASQGGYLLELDLDEMAASGGVDINHFAIELSMFSEQGEFASEVISEALYQRSAHSTGGLLFQQWLNDNKWLKSFTLGEKTLLLVVSAPTGLSASLVALLCSIALFFSALVQIIVQLIRKRHRAQKLQRIESEKLYQTRYRAAVTLASIDDAVLTASVDEKILYVNEAAEKLLGYSESEMQGRTLDSVVILEKEGDCLALISPNGARSYVNKKHSPLKDQKGELSGYVVVLRDITVEHHLTSELMHKVNHDLLTGLANRLNFENQLHEMVLSSEQVIDGHVLCFIDLDRFKEVNDTCGHDAGDELLKRVAETFTVNVRDYDVVARLGGDEFGIVLKNCTREAAMIVTERIQRCYQSFYFDYEGHVFPVRCSIGLVHFHPGSCSFDDVIKTADAACFDAKGLGRNSVCERSLGDNTKKTDHGSKWLPRLKFALENSSFELLTQSVCSLNDNTTTSHEVLLRLREDGASISPALFMRSAVRYELAESIDRWVVMRTLENMAMLQVEYVRDKFIINLSSQSIESSEFTEFLKQQIHQCGIDPARLCFDIKESDLLSKPAGAVEFCRELRAIGSEVALDDFGAGMTSFSLLKSVLITTLKIDGSLIANLKNYSVGENSADHAMIRSISSFASSMGLTTIAEQVETTDCLETLRLLNIGYVQGAAVAAVQPFDILLVGRSSGGAQIKAA